MYLHWQMTGCNIKLPILDLHFYFLQSVIMKTIFFCCLSGQVFREIKLVLHTSTHHCVKWNFKKNRKTTWNACDQHSLQQHTDIIHDTIMHENACNLFWYVLVVIPLNTTSQLCFDLLFPRICHFWKSQLSFSRNLSSYDCITALNMKSLLQFDCNMKYFG